MGELVNWAAAEAVAVHWAHLATLLAAAVLQAKDLLEEPEEQMEPLIEEVALAVAQGR
jgi:hypothetical protein